VHRRRRQNCWKLWRKILCQEGIEILCRQAHRRRELFEFCDLRKIPLRDLHRVPEHPDRLSNRLLEQIESQEGIIFSI
jgi:hypothetical protein